MEKAEIRLDPGLGLAARLIVGIIFIASGTLKAAAPPEEFAVVIESYRIIHSQEAILFMATFLPWLEAIIGFSLAFGFYTRAAAVSAGAMLLTFIAALLLTKLRGLELPNCGCFGFGFHPSTWHAVIMDTLLCAVVVQAWRRGSEFLSLDLWCGQEPASRT